MTLNTQKERLQYWRNWTLFNALALIFSFIISFFVVILLAEFVFGISVDEWGSPFEQIVINLAAGSVIGFGIGITQYRILRKIVEISSFWIYSVAIGFILVELIIGIILWEMEINRGELNFMEGNSLAHTLILVVTGLLIGLIQIPLLRKHFKRVAYWVGASTVAWGLSVMITAIGQQSEVALLLTFILGALFYGAITGATLTWILKPKKMES